MSVSQVVNITKPSTAADTPKTRMQSVTKLFQSQMLVSRLSCLRRDFCSSCSRWQKQPNLRYRLRPDRTNFRDMGYILLLAPALTLYLGTWQVKRRKWKIALIEEVQQKTLAEPMDFPQDLDELEDLEYRRIRVRGTFDHSRELYITPRSLFKPDVKGRAGLLSGQAEHGGHVVTAFRLADSNLEIMVNRGWVSRKMMNPAQRQSGQIPDEVELVGVFRKSEKRQQFAAKNDPERHQWHSRDHEGMACDLHTTPVYIEADQASSVPGGPMGGQTRLSLRNEHLSYIITWYSLTAIMTAMWYQKYWRPR